MCYGHQREDNDNGIRSLKPAQGFHEYRIQYIMSQTTTSKLFTSTLTSSQSPTMTLPRRSQTCSFPLPSSTPFSSHFSLLFRRQRFPPINKMKSNIKMKIWILHTLPWPDHHDPRLLMAETQDSCEERHANWLNGIDALREEVEPNFFESSVFRPAA